VVPSKLAGMVAVNVNAWEPPGFSDEVVQTFAAVQVPPLGVVGLAKTGVTPFVAVSVKLVEPAAVPVFVTVTV
jgi:hypothetical protein